MRTTTSVRPVSTFLTAAVVAAAAMALTAGVAHADDIEETAGMFEFKLGPYHPMIDDEFDNGPYQQFFGDQGMLLGEIAFDYHLWRKIGTLSLGLHAGYSRVSAPMTDQQGSEVDADDQSALRNIPLKASLVYRYDYSAHRHNIPLVPVAKAGVNYNFWRVTDAGGNTMEVDGQLGAGGTAGIHATLGLHLHLDIFDPTGAASLDMLWGVTNSFLFAEYTWVRTDVFDDAGLNLGANHWAAGLAFEF